MKRTLIALLLTALAAPAALAGPPTAAELLRLVPDGAQAVVAVDSAALRAHPLVQTWLLRQHAWTATDSDVERFLRDAGLDPVRDVDVIVVATVGAGDKTAGVALFAGRYDPASLAAALVKRGARALAIAGTAGYQLPDSGCDGGRALVLAQPSADLVVVGDQATVAQVLGRPHAIPALVAGEIAAGRLDTRAPFWMVANVPAKARQHASEVSGRVQGEASDAVRGVVLASGTVQRVMAQAHLDDVLRLSGAALADTPENAELLRDALKGALAVARLHAQDAAPDLVDVLRGVELDVDGTAVIGRGAISVALLEKLAAEHGGAAHGHEL